MICATFWGHYVTSSFTDAESVVSCSIRLPTFRELFVESVVVLNGSSSQNKLSRNDLSAVY